MRSREVRIAPATAKDLPFVRRLLSESGLPVEGAGEHVFRFLVARRGSRRVGCVGMEVYGEEVLLRSLAVVRGERNAGIGAALLARALEAALAAGGKRAWGLTVFGRSRLFERFGFRVVPRPEAPPGLSGSLQFQGVCPESAVLIGRPLG